MGSQTYLACVSPLLRAAASRKNIAQSQPIRTTACGPLSQSAPLSVISMLLKASILPLLLSRAERVKFTLLCTAQQLVQVWFGPSWCLPVSKTSFSFLVCVLYEAAEISYGICYCLTDRHLFKVRESNRTCHDCEWIA